jgi:putative thiamine transport system substrate-binding protein
LGKLPEADRTAFAALDLGVATLPPDKLGPALAEPHPDWMTRIEAEWIKRYGAAN